MKSFSLAFCFQEDFRFVKINANYLMRPCLSLEELKAEGWVLRNLLTKPCFEICRKVQHNTVWLIRLQTSGFFGQREKDFWYMRTIFNMVRMFLVIGADKAAQNRQVQQVTLRFFQVTMFRKHQTRIWELGLWVCIKHLRAMTGGLLPLFYMPLFVKDPRW